MMFKCYDQVFNVPDEMITRYTKDFEVLKGGAHEDKISIRNSIYDILELVKLDTSMLDEPEYKIEFITALAMRQALKKNGILYDA
jgi:hypothetical protein